MINFSVSGWCEFSPPSVPISALPFFRVNAATIDSTAISATLFSASVEIVPTGCGTSTRGNSLMPRVALSVFASVINSSVTIVAVGIPACSSCTESWTLHDVQEPQSAKAFMTTSQCPASSFRQSASMRVIFRFETSSTPSITLLE